MDRTRPYPSPWVWLPPTSTISLLAFGPYLAEDRTAYVRRTWSKAGLGQIDLVSYIEITAVHIERVSRQQGREHRAGSAFQVHGALEVRDGVLVVID